MQNETPDLAASLLDKGFSVLIETNGTQNIDSLPDNCHLIIDIKTPGSGENDKIKWSILNSIRKKDELKFVVTDRNDYEWSKEVLKKYNLEDKCSILISAADKTVHTDKVAEWILKDRLRARLQLQMHKILWPYDSKR